MLARNSEAPLAATLGASIENNREGNIDMSIVATSDLNFQGEALVPVTLLQQILTEIWQHPAPLIILPRLEFYICRFSGKDFARLM